METKPSSPTHDIRASVIIPAAGTGERMGLSCKKPYIPLCGEPLLVHTLKAFIAIPGIECIILPVFPGEEQQCREKILGQLPVTKDIQIISGGNTRQESVRNALARLPRTCTMVMIHDGARPLVSAELILLSLNETRQRKATTAAVTVKDTTAFVSADGSAIERTVTREQLISIQTPQTFTRDIIVLAHKEAAADGFPGTDDAGLVARLGVPVFIVPGSYTNIKITTREDLLLAETLLSRQTASENKNEDMAGS